MKPYVYRFQIHNAPGVWQSLSESPYMNQSHLVLDGSHVVVWIFRYAETPREALEMCKRDIAAAIGHIIQPRFLPRWEMN